jgi:hypothetical protein
MLAMAMSADSMLGFSMSTILGDRPTLARHPRAEFRLQIDNIIFRVAGYDVSPLSSEFVRYTRQAGESGSRANRSTDGR